MKVDNGQSGLRDCRGLKIKTRVQAGNCAGGYVQYGSNRFLGTDCQQCPPEAPDLLCTGIAPVGSQPVMSVGEHCRCV